MSKADVMNENLLDIATVLEISGMSRTTIWRQEKKGKFPRRRYVSERSPRWVESEIREWKRRLIEQGKQASI